MFDNSLSIWELSGEVDAWSAYGNVQLHSGAWSAYGIVQLHSGYTGIKYLECRSYIEKTFNLKLPICIIRKKDDVKGKLQS